MSLNIEIESKNNFYTAAGLASSSSGLSCLGIALANLYGLPKDSDHVDFSMLARLGSGSAVRSVYGGFVKWNKGWETKEEKQAILRKDEDTLNRISLLSVAHKIQLQS